MGEPDVNLVYIQPPISVLFLNKQLWILSNILSIFSNIKAHFQIINLLVWQMFLSQATNTISLFMTFIHLTHIYHSSFVPSLVTPFIHHSDQSQAFYSFFNFFITQLLIHYATPSDSGLSTEMLINSWNKLMSLGSLVFSAFILC